MSSRQARERCPRALRQRIWEEMKGIAVSRPLEFPPLLSGLAVAGDPFLAACEAAETADPGTVFYAPDDATMRAAILLAPETPLNHALGVSFAISLGMSDALGSLAPPEVAVHLEWPDRIRVNGALCGRMRAAASTADPGEEPDWLVFGIDIPVLSQGQLEPGANPDETCMHDEGCGEIGASALIEAWGRHMMNWLHIFLTEGFEPLHREWLAKAHGRETGGFLGLDEHGGLILKDDGTTRILALAEMLERP